MKPHDPELGAVERSDLVKGYEYEKDKYVIFTEEDFDKVQIESSKAIVIEKFVDANEVDAIYLDSPYYLAPDGAMAEETFRVVQQAMREKDKVALSRVVLSNRERLIALDVPRQGLPDDDPAHRRRGARRQGLLHRHPGREARAGDARAGRER